VCCSVLQCVVECRVWQHFPPTVCCSVLQCAAVCCSVMQRGAECCSELQYVAVLPCVALSLVQTCAVRGHGCMVAMCCSVLQQVILCCSVLQCHLQARTVQYVALYSKILQYIAICLTLQHIQNVLCLVTDPLLQCVAVCCSVLQCVAVCCSVP